MYSFCLHRIDGHTWLHEPFYSLKDDLLIRWTSSNHAIFFQVYESSETLRGKLPYLLPLVWPRLLIKRDLTIPSRKLYCWKYRKPVLSKMPGLKKIIGHQSLNSSKSEKSEKWNWRGWFRRRKTAHSTNQLVPNVEADGALPREYDDIPSHSQGGKIIPTSLIPYKQSI